jgi:hypothetical protein
MRIAHFTPLAAVAAFLLAGPHAAAKTITCPPPGTSATLDSGGKEWSLPYEGALNSVEMRAQTSGDQNGEATVYCGRARGAVSLSGRHCKLTPGAGGRITTKTESGAEVVTCTLLGTSGTNDTACFVVCD